jgi:hypothetical protein
VAVAAGAAARVAADRVVVLVVDAAHRAGRAVVDATADAGAQVAVDADAMASHAIAMADGVTAGASWSRTSSPSIALPRS